MPLLHTLVALLLAALAQAAHAQPVFNFATVAEGRAIVSVREDFADFTAPLERRMLLSTRQDVSVDQLVRHMAESVLPWTEEEQKKLRPLLARLEQFLAGVRPVQPGRILLVKTSGSFIDGAPHTRANAIILPLKSYEIEHGALPALYVLAHELSHVVSRNNPELRERLYASLGFQRCGRVEIPRRIADLRLTNPDAPESLHTIPARHNGKWIDALPYVLFEDEKVDTSAGLNALMGSGQLRTSWLSMIRDGEACKVREDAGNGVPPTQLDSLYGQIGRNTEYLFGPEEIVADNFALLVLSSVGKGLSGAPPLEVPSPDILEQFRRILGGR